jgi:phosphoglycerate dehydrogenase-like enzyme
MPVLANLGEVMTVCLPDDRGRHLVGELPAGVTAVVWDGTGAAPAEMQQVEFLVPPYGARAFDAAQLARMPNVQVIQLLSAGAESWLPVRAPGVTLCNARGVHGASTAELAVAGMSSVLRELPAMYAAQRERRWAPRDTDALVGKRVLVLGAGDIGSRIATAVVAFGARATMVARTARDGVRAMTELAALMPEHDVVAVAVPHTDETHHLVDAAFLAALPDGALVVNVARGGIVDTGALLAELTARRLRAFLDVTDPEPLPPGHPLWEAPNLLLTPHVGGGTRDWQQRGYQLVRAQLLRYLRGEPLENVLAH